MNKPSPVFVPLRKVINWLQSPVHALTGFFSNNRRPPELQELEEQFTKDSDIDPEKLRDRQVSATIRSGRG